MIMWSIPRNPERIKRILEKIRILWEDTPDLRLGQFLQNIFGSIIGDQPIYFKEDDEIEDTLDYLLKTKTKIITIVYNL